MEFQDPPLHGEFPGQMDHFCRIDVPLHSSGIWGSHRAHDFLNNALPRLQFQLAIIFLLTQSLHFLINRFARMPHFTSEMLAGLILGPTMLGKHSKVLFPPEGEIFINLLSKVGYIFLMLLIGVRMEPGMIFRTGKKAWVIGLVSLLVSNMVSLLSSELLVDNLVEPIYRRIPTKSIIGAQTLTPFVVVYCFLVDAKIMNTELGRLALATTLINDLFGTGISTLISIKRMAMAAGWMTISVIVQSLIATMALVLAVVFVFRPFSLKIIKKTPMGKPVKRGYVIIISGLALLSAMVSNDIGLSYSLGPFLVGLTVPAGPPLGSTLVEKLNTLVSGMLVPLFATNCMMMFNLFEVYDIQFQGTIFLIFITSVAVKTTAVIVPAMFCKVPAKDSITLAVIMSSQGIVELAVYLNMYLSEAIDTETFATVNLTVLLMSVITMPLINLMYDPSRKYTGYQKRDILNSPKNTELRMLVCAHRKDDALALLKLLEASSPTKENSVAVYALYLQELVGRASPLLINHELGQKAPSRRFRSKEIIDLFYQFQQEHEGVTSVQVFTAISLNQFMQEDICSIALDKLASIVILPFHRKWNYNGKMILDSDVTRTINNSVLSMAPCSVGILVDRHKIRGGSSVSSLLYAYRLAVIFLGGNDDREVIAFAKRIAKSSGVHLTVIRLTALHDIGDDPWETILNAENLKDIKYESSTGDKIVYKEEAVQDGSDTASVVQSASEAFDLIMVGRHHEESLPQLTGLQEWAELPELGLLGDMLASADIARPASVLIVQQQLVQAKH